VKRCSVVVRNENEREVRRYAIQLFENFCAAGFDSVCGRAELRKARGIRHEDDRSW
jgi:hypothetical protein